MIKYLILLIVLIVLIVLITNKCNIENFTMSKLFQFYDNKYSDQQAYTFYYVDASNRNIISIITNMVKNILAFTNILFIKKFELKHNNQLINVFTKKQGNNFYIVDDLLTKHILSKNIKTKEKFNEVYKKIRFVTNLSMIYIYPIINVGSDIDSFYKMTNIGILDLLDSKMYMNSVNRVYKIETGNMYKVHLFDNINEMIRNLRNKKIDCMLLLDYYPSSNLFKLLRKYPEFVIIPNNLNKTLILKTSPYLHTTTIDLNNISEYLPRKTIHYNYRKFMPILELYYYNTSLYCNAEIDEKIIYSIVEYYYNKYKTFKSRQDAQMFKYNYSFIFYDHPGLKKYLEDHDQIDYNPNPKCMYIKGKCDKRGLEIYNMIYGV